MMNIFWFRRDLRIEDNTALFYALQNDGVLPIFIFDTNIISELPADDSRLTFIHSLLEKIQGTFFSRGKSLAVYHGEPIAILRQLITDNKISSVYANRDYEPYALKRDLEIENLLSENGINFHTFKDHVIFEKDEIVKDDGKPYVVFTPYSRKWKSSLTENGLIDCASQDFIGNICSHSYPFLSLEQMGFQKSKITPPDYDLSPNRLYDYEITRNIPSAEQTSNLSPYLRFGSVSIRTIVSIALRQKNETFLNELIWREFFMQILWHFPETVTKSFRPKYDTIKWRNNELEFAKWCEGKTGYPIVDAGMRQLNATGLMHNRVRMITASFLCKHLLIDWRWGEAYFALKLLDYEQASNVGNWQWASGSGVDAAPYFRIFNPSEQVKKFDKDLKYIRKWVPELDDFTYPEPIVDHKVARQKCLQVYAEALR